MTQNEQQMKVDYDKRNKVKTPSFKIGEEVLLED